MIMLSWNPVERTTAAILSKLLFTKLGKTYIEHVGSTVYSRAVASSDDKVLPFLLKAGIAHIFYFDLLRIESVFLFLILRVDC